MEEKGEKSILDIIAEHGANEGWMLSYSATRSSRNWNVRSEKKWGRSAGSDCQKRSGGQWTCSCPPMRRAALITVRQHTYRDSRTALRCSRRQGL